MSARRNHLDEIQLSYFTSASIVEIVAGAINFENSATGGFKLTSPENPKKTHHLIESLKDVKDIASKTETTSIGDIFSILSGRGYAVLLTLMTFPFTLPIQIPGFSTPFGLIMAFLGLRLAFGKHLWWPEWILNRQISSKSVDSIVEHLINFFESDKMNFLRPRFPIFLHPFFHRLNGLLICFLSLLLALPLPLPLSNIIPSVPLLCISLGLLEDDGLFIAIGYALSALIALCIIAMALYFIFYFHAKGS
jgi:hypothetical protein